MNIDNLYITAAIKNISGCDRVEHFAGYSLVWIDLRGSHYGLVVVHSKWLGHEADLQKRFNLLVNDILSDTEDPQGSFVSIEMDPF